MVVESRQVTVHSGTISIRFDILYGGNVITGYQQSRCIYVRGPLTWNSRISPLMCELLIEAGKVVENHRHQTSRWRCSNRFVDIRLLILTSGARYEVEPSRH